MRAKRQDIEAAKGLAILLVVFGHLVARQDPLGVYWYEPLRRAIYAFHMPLFLYLSGLVAVYSGFLRQPRTVFWRLARARTKRLLVPFFGLGLLVVGGKILASRFMFVDNAPAGLAAGLAGLVWDTAHSPALSIWYLFVLYVVSLGSLVLLDGRAARLPMLLGAALLLFWLPLPAYIYADRIFTFAPFFLVGAAAGFAGARWEAWMDRYWAMAMALFVPGLAAVALRDHGLGEAQKLILLPMGCLALPAIHGMLRNLRANWLQDRLLFLGRYSFMIYLCNTLCIGAAKGILLHVCAWDGAHFLPFAMVLMSAGLFGPIALKTQALRHVRALDRMTD